MLASALKTPHRHHPAATKQNASGSPSPLERATCTCAMCRVSKCRSRNYSAAGSKWPKRFDMEHSSSQCLPRCLPRRKKQRTKNQQSRGRGALHGGGRGAQLLHWSTHFFVDAKTSDGLDTKNHPAETQMVLISAHMCCSTLKTRSQAPDWVIQKRETARVSEHQPD